MLSVSSSPFFLVDVNSSECCVKIFNELLHIVLYLVNLFIIGFFLANKESYCGVGGNPKLFFLTNGRWD